MALLAELGQIMISLAIAGVTAYWLGTTYVIIAVFMALTCSALLIGVIHEQPIAPLAGKAGAPHVVGIVLTALVFGVIWPAIPFIFAWGSWRDHEREREAARDDVS